MAMERFSRLRSLRSSEAIRSLVRETHLCADHLIQPLFVSAQATQPRPVDSMPGVMQYPLSEIVTVVGAWRALGIRAVLLFGVPQHKTEQAEEAWAETGVVQQAIRLLKSTFRDMYIFVDTCVCAYTSHGHCGHLVVDDSCPQGWYVDNDRSLALHAQVAVAQARAGADCIAPSSMLDGIVIALRQALDAAQFGHIPIMAYSVKYASAFYGPFRDVADSSPHFGDRQTYQMDSANIREALREAQADVVQGADLLMVKPAMAYLDVVRLLREQFALPIVAYHVSGEYSMIKAAAERGWVQERAVVLETLLCMRRAGADAIITYYAADVARWLSTSHTRGS